MEEIGYQLSARPLIRFNHVDGPLLCMRNGELHWLTWRERIACVFGRANALSLERKHRPHLIREED